MDAFAALGGGGGGGHGRGPIPKGRAVFRVGHCTGAADFHSAAVGRRLNGAGGMRKAGRPIGARLRVVDVVTMAIVRYSQRFLAPSLKIVSHSKLVLLSLVCFHRTRFRPCSTRFTFFLLVSSISHNFGSSRCYGFLS